MEPIYHLKEFLFYLWLVKLIYFCTYMLTCVYMYVLVYMQVYGDWRSISGIFYYTLFWFLKIYFYFICRSVLPVCVSVYHIHDAHEGQKRALDPLELELKEGASVYVLETDPGPSARTTNVLHCWAISLAPFHCGEVLHKVYRSEFPLGMFEEEPMVCGSLDLWQLLPDCFPLRVFS